MKHIASFSPLGPVQIEERRHTGTLFDLYLVTRDQRSYYLKTPAPRLPQQSESAFVSRATGIETSLWGGTTSSQIEAAHTATWLQDALLMLEAEKIRQTRGAWNHSVISMGMWDGPDNKWKLSELFTQQRFRSAMLMPQYPGCAVSHLSPVQQRYMWPRMMSSMWNALADTSHGDISPNNIILSPTGDRFVLIDPGVALWSSADDNNDKQVYMDHGILMTCNASHYPILPPTYTPPQAFGNHATIEHHLQWLAQVSTTDLRGVVVATAPFMPLPPAIEAAMLQQLRNEAPLPPADTSGSSFPRSPADLMATGILYYQILAQQHPFFAADEPATPLWSGAFGEGREQHQRKAYLAHLARWQNHEIQTPRELNPEISQEESDFAMSLLGLRIPDYETLLKHIVEACRQTEKLSGEASLLV